MLPENFQKLQRSLTGDVGRVNNLDLKRTSDSPFVFRPKSPCQEASVVSTVTNQIVLPKADKLQIDLDETGNAFRS